MNESTISMENKTAPSSCPIFTCLTLEDWEQRAEKHRTRLSDFIEEHRNKRTLGLKHPVYDFLFSYYSFSRGQLLRWSPGILVGLESNSESNLDWKEFYTKRGSLYYIDPGTFPSHRIPYLKWAIQFLSLTIERTPIFHCFGLHEWAMLYKSESKQHPQVPLRVSHSTLNEIIEQSQLCCTHYDAFRFFTAESKPQNKSQLTRESVIDSEQPACIHANMDLYKFGYKIAPFIASDLLLELFLLARRTRELDMRASPYDLCEYGFAAIKIETKTGREEYVLEQRKIHSESMPLRKKLLDTYLSLLPCQDR